MVGLGFWEMAVDAKGAWVGWGKVYGWGLAWG